MSFLLGAALAMAMREQVTMATTTDRGRGRYLYRACQALNRVNATPTGEKANPEDAAWAHECSGYIEGWLDALLDGSGALEQRGVCPHEWTTPQVAHIYVVYVDKHKDMMNLESGMALRMALKEKFPCAKK
ncbi:MAG TPA: Rap1a/Tai family immunity protein [Acidobacteriaceae bacterium]